VFRPFKLRFGGRQSIDATEEATHSDVAPKYLCPPSTREPALDLAALNTTVPPVATSSATVQACPTVVQKESLMSTPVLCTLFSATICKCDCYCKLQLSVRSCVLPGSETELVVDMSVPTRLRAREPRSVFRLELLLLLEESLLGDGGGVMRECKKVSVSSSNNGGGGDRGGEEG
jgi:hypothetical protein